MISASMLPLKEILLQSGRLLRRHPALLLPVVAGALAFQLTLGNAAASLPVTVAFWLLNLALTAGLLTMIRSFHQSEMSGWDAFLVGVGRYFAPILAGSMVQLALVLLTLLPIVAWLKGTVGVPDFAALQAGALPNDHQIEQLSQWGAALCAWAGVWGIVFFFLALWKQAVVAQSLSWLRAWQASAAFVKSHWLPMAGLLTLELLGLVAGGSLVAAKISGLAELGAVAVLLVNCFFTIAMMVAILGPEPIAKGENVDAAA